MSSCNTAIDSHRHIDETYEKASRVNRMRCLQCIEEMKRQHSCYSLRAQAELHMQIARHYKVGDRLHKINFEKAEECAIMALSYNPYAIECYSFLADLLLHEKQDIKTLKRVLDLCSTGLALPRPTDPAETVCKGIRAQEHSREQRVDYVRKRLKELLTACIGQKDHIIRVFWDSLSSHEKEKIFEVKKDDLITFCEKSGILKAAATIEEAWNYISKHQNSVVWICSCCDKGFPVFEDYYKHLEDDVYDHLSGDELSVYPNNTLLSWDIMMQNASWEPLDRSMAAGTIEKSGAVEVLENSHTRENIEGLKEGLIEAGNCLLNQSWKVRKCSNSEQRLKNIKTIVHDLMGRNFFTEEHVFLLNSFTKISLTSLLGERYIRSGLQETNFGIRLLLPKELEQLEKFFVDLYNSCIDNSNVSDYEIFETPDLPQGETYVLHRDSIHINLNHEVLSSQTMFNWLHESNEEVVEKISAINSKLPSSIRECYGTMRHYCRSKIEAMAYRDGVEALYNVLRAMTDSNEFEKSSEKHNFKETLLKWMKLEGNVSNPILGILDDEIHDDITNDHMSLMDVFDDSSNNAEDNNILQKLINMHKLVIFKIARLDAWLQRTSWEGEMMERQMMEFGRTNYWVVLSPLLKEYIQVSIENLMEAGVEP